MAKETDSPCLTSIVVGGLILKAKNVSDIEQLKRELRRQELKKKESYIK